jgi:hypothetical protein
MALVPGALYVARRKMWFSHLHDEGPGVKGRAIEIVPGDPLIYLRERPYHLNDLYTLYHEFLTARGVATYMFLMNISSHVDMVVTWE